MNDIFTAQERILLWVPILSLSLQAGGEEFQSQSHLYSSHKFLTFLTILTARSRFEDYLKIILKTRISSILIFSTNAAILLPSSFSLPIVGGRAISYSDKQLRAIYRFLNAICRFLQNKAGKETSPSTAPNVQLTTRSFFVSATTTDPVTVEWKAPCGMKSWFQAFPGPFPAAKTSYPVPMFGMRNTLF